MQYDRLSFGWRTENGTPASRSNFNINAYNRIYSQSFKPPESGISNIRLLAEMYGSITNSNHKLYIVESIVGKLYQTVTISTTNNTLTLTNYHNIIVNDRIVVFGDTMPVELTRGNIYWVINVNGNDIKISTTQGGSEIDLTTSGSNVCVSKYIDHSSLNNVTSIEGVRSWLDFTSFNSTSLSSDKIYYIMYLNLESNSGSNFPNMMSINAFDNWAITQYTTSITTLNRSYNTSIIQHRITYANGFVDDFLVGYGNNNAISIDGANYIYGNLYKNNTETKLYIRSAVLNGYFSYSSAEAKDSTYVARIRDKATKNVLATSIPLKPYGFATSATTNQYFYFEFADAYELAVNQEVIISIEYYSGYITLSSNIRVGYFGYNGTYYNGAKILFQRRGRTEPLLWQGSITTTDGTNWTENTGANARMYFIELQFDTFKPTGSVGGASVEPSYVF